MIHHLNTKKANGPENIAVKYYKLANEYIWWFTTGKNWNIIAKGFRN